MPPTTVDIWLVPIPTRFDPEEERRLSSLLSHEEQDQMRQMGHSGRRNEYLLGHALARFELARILKVEPARVPLVFLDGKRPMVAAPGYDGPVYLRGDGGLTMGGLFLSLSHSASFVALAVATVPVGIDVHPILSRPNPDNAAEITFTDPELASYRTLSGDDRALRYAQLWALHEAMIKGAGELHDQVRRRFSFEVAGSRVRVVTAGGDGALGDESWQASLATPDDGQVMAVVARTPVGSSSLIPAIHRESVSGLVGSLSLIAGAVAVPRAPTAERPRGQAFSSGVVVEGTAVRRLEPAVKREPAPDTARWDRLFARAPEGEASGGMQRLFQVAEQRAAALGLSHVFTSLRRLEEMPIERLVPLFRVEGLIARLKRDARYADLARSIERGEVRLDPVERLLCRLALATNNADEIGTALGTFVGRAHSTIAGRAPISPTFGVGVPVPSVGSPALQVLR